MVLRFFITAGIVAVLAVKLELPDYLVQQHRPVIFCRTEIIEGIVFTPWVDLMSNDDWFISVKGCVNCNITGFTNTTDPRFAASWRNFSVTYGSFGEVANGKVSGRIWKLDPIQGGPFEIPVVDEISSVSATWNAAGEPSSARIGLNSDFSNRMKLKSIYLNYEYICSSAEFDSDEK
uniref:Conserved secreted protein n=1 Tax=Bursaphelenchus xylophilus TaxID=6326 RepID=A0A1I7RJ59_BURXY